MAVVSIPISEVPSIIKECVKAEIGGAIIISAEPKLNASFARHMPLEGK